MANGITHNKDKSEIYVADTFDKTVSIFKRNNDNSLTMET